MIKNKKGSILVERILMTAFAVAAGGAITIYGSNVITNAKNTQITGILGNGLTQQEIEAHFDDDSRTITMTAAELNGRSFPNFASALKQRQDYYYANWNDDIEIRSSLVYDGITFYSNVGLTDEANFIHFTSDGYTTHNNRCRMLLGFTFKTEEWCDLPAGKWFIVYDECKNWDTDSSVLDTFQADIEWNITGDSYSDIKQALVQDLS